MADSHAKMTQATPQEIIISVLAGLLAPLLAIFLIVQLVLSIQDKHQPDTTSEAAQKATLERIKPFAHLVALDANAPKVEKSGQEVFEAVCTTCHTPGALGAPKFGNKGDWGPRISQGYETLIKHALEGIRQMPPRGGDGDLSDLEVERAVAWKAPASVLVSFEVKAIRCEVEALNFGIQPAQRRSFIGAELNALIIDLENPGSLGYQVAQPCRRLPWRGR